MGNVGGRHGAGGTPEAGWPQKSGDLRTVVRQPPEHDNCACASPEGVRNARRNLIMLQWLRPLSTVTSRSAIRIICVRARAARQVATNESPRQP